MATDISRYPQHYSMCRAVVGHCWGLDDHKRTGELFVYVCRCDRCGMVRTTTYNKWGDYIDTKYNQPEGYRLTGGASRKDVRAGLFARPSLRVVG